MDEHTYSRKKLLHIAQAVQKGDRISPEDISYLNGFTHNNDEHSVVTFLKNSAFPIAVLCGAVLAANSDFFDGIFSYLPSWTNLNPAFLSGFDYVWSIIGNPVEKSNIIYHIPNIVMYSAGFISIKSIIDSIKKRNWLDIVTDGQAALRQKITDGTLAYQLESGHSILFVGKGDFIAMQYSEDHNPDQCITLAEIKPPYTDIWNIYKTESHEADLKNALDRVEASDAGEYIFFPVQDKHLFLPSPTAFDMPPHRIDLHCQNIRKLEKTNKWARNPIFIVGDKYHKSIVRTENKTGLVDGTEDIISIETIAKRYPQVKIVDPTEIVLKHVLKMAHNRKIIFRATIEGIEEYKKRFYQRLDKLGYGENPKAKGVFIVGYDIYEDQIEQQKLCGKLDDYYPVVLSKNVYDALISNGHKDSELIYVPDLVIEELRKLADQQ